jgi:gluconate 5-dehydrogenase
MKRFDLTGRTALVTGSSRGIAMALAKALLEGGARVVVYSRERKRAETTAAGLIDEPAV